jgi:hypothetical protein
MRIVDVREATHMIASPIRNAYIDFSKMTTSVVAVVTDVILESGDPSKPYRYIPLFAPGTSVPLGAPVELVNRLRTSVKPLEQLPLSRERVALWGQLLHRASRMTFRGDERLYVDSWGLKATTTDGRVLFDLGRRVALGPHVRVHAQSAVDFWQRAYTLSPGFSVPALRTGDRELGPLVTLTGGMTARWAFGPAAHPRQWALGVDVNASTTRYLDDLYTTHRSAVQGALTLETER